jgi:hypothetical protein
MLLVEQIFGRIAANSQLRKSQQVCARPDRLGIKLPHPPGVARQITHDGIELS